MIARWRDLITAKGNGTEQDGSSRKTDAALVTNPAFIVLGKHRKRPSVHKVATTKSAKGKRKPGVGPVRADMIDRQTALRRGWWAHHPVEAFADAFTEAPPTSEGGDDDAADGEPKSAPPTSSLVTPPTSFQVHAKDYTERQLRHFNDPASQFEYLAGGTEREPHGVEGAAGAFMVYTSNVDAHSYDYFKANEIRECHGNIELLQCSRPTACSGPKAWRMQPFGHMFELDAATMKVPAAASAGESGTATTPTERKADRKNRLANLPPPLNPEAWSLAVPTTFATDSEDSEEEDGTTNYGRPKVYVKPSNANKQLYTAAAAAGGGGGGRKMPAAGEGAGGESTDSPVVPHDATSSPRARGGHPSCPACGRLARPAILMFGDSECVENTGQAHRYACWKAALVSLCADRADAAIPAAVQAGIAAAGGKHDKGARASGNGARASGNGARASGNGASSSSSSSSSVKVDRLRVCILEIGAGGRITTVRNETENFASAIQKAGGRVTIVRINPDLPLRDDRDVLNGVEFISIMSKGLRALADIDAHIPASA